MKVCIMGAGYVGCSLAEVIGVKHDTICYDPSKPRSEHANYTVTNEAVPEDCQVYIICVPTPLANGEPDHRYVAHATAQVAEAASGDELTFVCVESTVAIGTTRNLVQDILQSEYPGKNFAIGFSPERVSPGDVSITSAVKVVAGLTPLAHKFFAAFYGDFFEIHLAESPEVAEMAKLVENTQRDVNIAFMNEANRLANNHNVDFQQVLAACRTKWNFADFRPGLVGGHCIAVDPHFLIGNSYSQLMRKARGVNDWEPIYQARYIIEHMPEGTEEVVVLGLNYKPGVKDARNAGVFKLCDELKAVCASFDRPIRITRLSHLDQYEHFRIANSDRNYFTVIAVEEEEFAGVDGYRLYKKGENHGR